MTRRTTGITNCIYGCISVLPRIFWSSGRWDKGQPPWQRGETRKKLKGEKEQKTMRKREEKVIRRKKKGGKRERKAAERGRKKGNKKKTKKEKEWEKNRRKIKRKEGRGRGEVEMRTKKGGPLRYCKRNDADTPEGQWTQVRFCGELFFT